MSKWAKFWETLVGGQSDNNIPYDALVAYLERLGWEMTSAGTSHRVYKHSQVSVNINVQSRKDGKAKSYQVKQVRQALDLYVGEDKDGWLRGESLL